MVLLVVTLRFLPTHNLSLPISPPYLALIPSTLSVSLSLHSSLSFALSLLRCDIPTPTLSLSGKLHWFKTKYGKLILPIICVFGVNRINILWAHHSHSKAILFRFHFFFVFSMHCWSWLVYPFDKRKKQSAKTQIRRIRSDCIKYETFGERKKKKGEQ